VWKNVVHALLGPIAHGLVRSVVRGDGVLATPFGTPIAHGSGPAPDRVLILGSTVVQGVGIASYDLSVAGHLARKLAARTGRGADIETRGIDKFDINTAEKIMRGDNLGRFDLILILGGVTEIVSLLPTSAYRRELRSLFAAIQANPTIHGPVILAGVAPFMQDMDVPPFVARWMAQRIVRQNVATREECERSGAAEYIPFAPDRAGIRLGRDSSAVYESWATALLKYVERALALTSSTRPVPVDESARQRAVDGIGELDADVEATVDRIVEMARDMLGADAASLNVIDHDRQISLATTGTRTGDLPRSEAICNTTIQRPGAYVIEDMDADPAFRDSTWASGVDHVRFYAGYPLEAPGGERVGALCVMNRTPRSFSDSETATLRDLALRAQAVLWEQRAS
jgi:hypothetical protein